MDMHARQEDSKRREYYANEKQRTLDYLASVLKTSEKPAVTIMDLCCGTGRITGLLADLPHVAKVYAVDINAQSLRSLNERLTPAQRAKVSTIEADATQPSRLPKADIVVSLESLVHLERLPQVFHNIALCLPARGLLIANCVPKERTFVWRKNIYGLFAYPVHMVDIVAKKLSRVTLFRRPLDAMGLLRSQKISRSRLLQLIAQAGFTIVKTVDTDVSFWFVAQKK